MTGISGRSLLAFSTIVLALSACEDGDLFGSGTGGSSNSASASAPTAASAEGRSEVREVERPDVFSITESGLWDGRPSLGGIWVAHPDVTTPERVRIENVSSGRVINGALFRRERINPGPRIQVSSDAADALGMLAGQPAELSIVAVREEEVEIAPILAPEGEAIDPEAISEDTAMPAEVDDITADAATVDEFDASMSVDAPSAPKPQRQGFFAALFGGGASQTEPVETQVVAADGDVVTTTSATAPDVETATLDPIEAASAAIDEAEANLSSAPAPSRPTGGTLRNPFVQVGMFSVEENAQAAAASLRDAGIVPSIDAGSNGDRAFWRVMVGPMTTADEQATMLGQIRDLGYRDAFLAPN